MTSTDLLSICDLPELMSIKASHNAPGYPQDPANYLVSGSLLCLYLGNEFALIQGRIPSGSFKLGDEVYLLEDPAQGWVYV